MVVNVFFRCLEWYGSLSFASSRLDSDHKPQYTPHHRTHPLGMLERQIRCGVGNGEARARDGKLTESIEPLDPLRVDIVGGVEIVDLRRAMLAIDACLKPL